MPPPYPVFDRILIIRPSALGDVCRSVPVLASLRAAFPSARIDWLVQDSFVEAIAAHPALSRVIPFPRRAFNAWWKPSVLHPIIAWLRDLRSSRYDLVLDCQGLARSGLFAYATRAPRRVGYAQAQELSWLGLTDRVDVPRDGHAVDRMLALVKHLGIPVIDDMRLYAPQEARAFVGAQPWSPEPYAVFAPTSRWLGKRWPAHRFAHLAEQTLAECPSIRRIIVVGSPTEREQCGPLLALTEKDPRVIDLIGKTKVGGLMAVVERSTLVVANDSACLHMAVGFNRPLVALYGPTRIDLVGPYKRDAWVIQKATPADDFDHKNDATGAAMMDRIAVDDVLCLVSKALTSSAGS